MWEQERVRAQVREMIRLYRLYRKQGPIIFLDETWTSMNGVPAFVWHVPDAEERKIFIPVGSGKASASSS